MTGSENLQLSSKFDSNFENHIKPFVLYNLRKHSDHQILAVYELFSYLLHHSVFQFFFIQLGLQLKNKTDTLFHSFINQETTISKRK